MDGKSWRWRWDALAIFVGEECATAEAEAAKQAFTHHRDDRHAGAAGALSRVLDQMVEMTAEPATPTLDDTLAGVLAWQRATFGPSELFGNLCKLRGEVGELCEAAIHGPPSEAEAELADVIIMAAGAADALGLTLAAVAETVAAKLEINRGRTWRQNADGTWSHVKGEAK